MRLLVADTADLPGHCLVVDAGSTVQPARGSAAVLAATSDADLLQCSVIQCLALLDQASVEVSAEQQHQVPLVAKCFLQAFARNFETLDQIAAERVTGRVRRYERAFQEQLHSGSASNIWMVSKRLSPDGCKRRMLRFAIKVRYAKVQSVNLCSEASHHAVVLQFHVGRHDACITHVTN